jgi:hypothetical protein
MEDKELLLLWQKGNDLIKNGQLGHNQMDKLLKPRISRLSVYVRIQLATYLLAQIASIVLLALNIPGYQGNMMMQAVSSGLIVFCLFFLYIGKGLYKSFKQISLQTSDILSLLKDKIIFFRHKFERWNFISAITLWILVFALNSYVDNIDGVYRINKPFFYIAVSIAMMVFIYLTNRSAAVMILKETWGCLRELENAWEDVEETLAKMKRRQRRLTLIAVVILTAFFILGLLVYLSRS